MTKVEKVILVILLVGLALTVIFWNDVKGALGGSNTEISEKKEKKKKDKKDKKSSELRLKNLPELTA